MRAKEGMEKNMPIGININYISASVLVETKPIYSYISAIQPIKYRL